MSVVGLRPRRRDDRRSMTEFSIRTRARELRRQDASGHHVFFERVRGRFFFWRNWVAPPPLCSILSEASAWTTEGLTPLSLFLPVAPARRVSDGALRGCARLVRDGVRGMVRTSYRATTSRSSYRSTTLSLDAARAAPPSTLWLARWTRTGRGARLALPIARSPFQSRPVWRRNRVSDFALAR